MHWIVGRKERRTLIAVPEGDAGEAVLGNLDHDKSAGGRLAAGQFAATRNLLIWIFFDASRRRAYHPNCVGLPGLADWGTSLLRYRTGVVGNRSIALFGREFGGVVWQRDSRHFLICWGSGVIVASRKF